MKIFDYENAAGEVWALSVHPRIWRWKKRVVNIGIEYLSNQGTETWWMVGPFRLFHFHFPWASPIRAGSITLC